MTAPVLQQASFRARGDTVGLNVDTWDHALNEDFTWEIGDTKRIRFTIAETATGMANNIAFSLQYNLNGAGFVAIGDEAAVRSALSEQFTNGDPTIQLISAGAFISGIGVEETTTSNISLQNNRTEIEWSLALDAAQLATGTNTIVIRVVQGSGTVLNTYTVEPTATVEKEAGEDVDALPSTGAVELSGQAPTWSATADIDAQPAVGAVSVTGFAPTVVAEASFTASPDVGAVELTGFAPTGSVAVDVDAQPGTDAINVIGFAPFLPVGLTERLTPNIVLAASNLKDTLDNIPPTRLADIDEPTGEDDDEWWTAVDPEQDIDVRFGFPPPPGNLVGTQQLRALIRATSLPSRDGTLELWEDGVKLTSEITEEVASIEGQVVTLTFDSSELSNQTGADVELRVYATESTVFAETWTGNNGDPWSSERWTGIEVTSSSVVDIQSNQGRMEPGGTEFARCRALSQSGSLSDFNLTMQFRLAAGGAEQYHAVNVRAGSGWTGNNVTNGYRISIYADGLELASYVEGIRTLLNFAAKTWGENQWNLRIQCEGTSIRVKVWQGSEPGTWDIDETNSDHSAGIISMTSLSGLSGIARPIFYDNLIAA